MARLSKTLASALLTLSGYGLLLLIVLAIGYGLFTLDYHLIWENIGLYLQGLWNTLWLVSVVHRGGLRLLPSSCLCLSSRPERSGEPGSIDG